MNWPDGPSFPARGTIVNRVASPHIGNTYAKYPGPARTRNLASANQRIDHMSFKDLTARAAAALKPKPAEKVEAPAKATEPKVAGNEAPTKSKTS